ncbi:hypothetical protein IDJ75_08345 [Mucilaginibacter rigui]|uniref:Uncharacterized protein n=1 Tax=Mucilaginibacter rigui TaxID=534635 RepID=A0ABR7X3X2_9SPHI|nr:hypothetical protein [Mucilaginibacter rigui]MBD1385285.1 hypothetical protein [Mucilaginibacter rigui]
MKNLLSVLFVLCVLASCKQKPAATDEPAAVTTSPDTAVTDRGPVEIPFELASRMVKNYEPHVGAVSKPDGTLASTDGNTRSVWLELDKLEKYVEILKKERAANGKTDGVRVYFGTYGDNAKEPATYDLDPNNSFRNTLVFVSTKDSVNLAKVHFHRDYFNDEKAFILTGPADKGELCPPPVKCCEIGAVLSCP